MIYSASIKPIRVLQIVTQMNRAGLESRLMDIYRNIDRNRVQFDFYTYRKETGVFDDEIISMGGRIYYNYPLRLTGIHEVSNRFKKFLSKNEEYKIVHCHLNQWCGLILKGAQKANVPVRIAHSRTSLQKNITLKSFVKNFIKLSTCRHATHFFAVSREAGEWLFGRRMVDLGRVEIWPNAIDCKKYIYSPQKRELMRETLGLSNELTLIHVGNFRPEKNHKFLFQIFKRVLVQENSAKLIVVGNGLMAENVRSLAKNLAIDNSILFLGSRNDVFYLLQAGDLFVFPSLFEGFPGAVLEAQAAGLPCIISDTITDEVCITDDIKQLPLGDTRLWVKEIMKMLHYNRKNTFMQLYRSGYDITNLSEKIMNYYIKIINNHKEKMLNDQV